MNWDHLRVFLAIARAGSMNGAAARLGVNQSTVSRQLAALEIDIGARLFDRGVHCHALTATGAELLDRAEAMEVEVARIDGAITGRDRRVQGTIRFTCIDVLHSHYLAPHLARFTATHPEVDLDVVTRYQHLSLARREADVAIRSTDRPPNSLVGRRLPNIHRAAYTSSDRAARLGPDPDPADLDWIGWENETYNRLMLTGTFPQAQIRHRADSLMDMHAMAAQGSELRCSAAFSQIATRCSPASIPRLSSKVRCHSGCSITLIFAARPGSAPSPASSPKRSAPTGPCSQASGPTRLSAQAREP
jgi:DNA-binding transcriptional LysR family regulator